MNNRILFLFLAISFNSQIVLSQSVHSDPDARLLDAARNIIDNAPSCALISLDKDGLSRVRAMDPFTPEDDFTIWFGTNAHSAKVQQIKNNSNVSLYYLDADNTGYVIIQGKAEIVDDPELKSKYWKEDWEDFYPDYPDAYSLIKVKPIWLEIISEKDEILGDPKTWKVPRVEIR